MWTIANLPTSANTFHVMKMARQSSMRVHDVVGEFAIFFLHQEGA
jgi:hypothetical protein